jgi:hypothetical protein
MGGAGMIRINPRPSRRHSTSSYAGLTRAPSGRLPSVALEHTIDE